MPQPNLNSDDYYAVLGCSRSADDATLKKSYRKLAVKWHPDKNPDDEEATRNFQKISEAYAILSDPKKRKLYDQYGKEGAAAADQMGENAPGPGFGFHPGGGHGGGAHHMSSDEAQAFFSQFFGNDDPFGAFGGGMGGGPRMHFQTSTNGRRPGGSSRRMNLGGGDPFSMIFGGGGPGGMGGMHQSMGGGMPGGMQMGGMPGMGGGMPGGFSQRQPIQYDAIPQETVVSLKGLVKSPDRNGDRGFIQQFDPRTRRYVVVLEDSEETMSVKPENLLQHVQVRLHAIESLPQLNGKTGTIIAWNSQKERYSIYVVSMKKAIGLKPANVILDEGTVGKIVGLQSKPELNNKWGTIKSWIRDSNRYDVQLSADKIIRVKVENIRV